MILPFFWLLWPLLYATGAIGMSTALSAWETALIYILHIAGGCLLPLRGVWYLLLAKHNGTRLRRDMLYQTVTECILSLCIIFLPRVSYQAFVVVLALYLSFHTAVQGINAFLYGRERIYQYFIPALSQAILFPLVILGLILLPDAWRLRFIMGGSAYLLYILGHAYLCDFLSVMVKNRRVADIFHKISVTMPGFGGLGVPSRLLHTLHSTAPVPAPDARIIFNFGKHGQGLAGHCELCVDGRTYTYGNYDSSSHAVLRTLGNGIIFRADMDRYVDFLLQENRTVVIYGLTLSDKQKAQLRANLDQLEQTLIPWQEQALSVSSEEYIHRIADTLDAHVYRITSGRFRNYFLPTINCVTLTGALLKGSAAGNVVVPGVYTPGAYMEMLHRLLMAGNDVVTSVTIYK